MKQKLDFRHVSPSISVSETWSLLFRLIKMLETMYDKVEFLQLLKYFLLNIILKQPKILIEPEIVTSLFLG